MVVTGGGDGSGNWKSKIRSPLPTGVSVRASDRGRMLQQPSTGSQRYSSSVSVSSRGRTCLSQCHVSCSHSRFVHSIPVPVMPADPTALHVHPVRASDLTFVDDASLVAHRLQELLLVELSAEPAQRSG